MSSQAVSKSIKKDRKIIALLPFFVSVVAFLVIKFCTKKNSFVIDRLDGLEDYKIMLSIWGTLLGFLITAVSILLTMGKDKFLDMLKDTGHYKTILFSYLMCCLHLLLAVILAIVCVFMKIWNMTLFAILCATVLDTVIRVAICLIFLFAIVMKNDD